MMKNDAGFGRLRGLLAVATVGSARLLAGSVARATEVTLLYDVTTGNAKWSAIGNLTTYGFPSSTSVTTTNGVHFSVSTPAFGIGDGTLYADTHTHGDALDNGLVLAVDGNLFLNPDGTVDLAIDLDGRTLTSDLVSDIVPGVNARVQYRFYGERPTVRAMYVLANTTGEAKTVDVGVFSDFGADANTTVRMTSDDDTTVEITDTWYIVDDNDHGDPRVTLASHGTGAAVVPFHALTPGALSKTTALSGFRYHVTIPPGEKVRIVVFMELSDPDVAIDGAVATAADFESLAAVRAAGLVDDLSEDGIEEIVNYALVFRDGFESNDTSAWSQTVPAPPG